MTERRYEQTTVSDVDAADAPPSSDEDGRTRTEGGSRAFALLLVITGAAGLLAAWVITIDKFKLLEDPNFTPGCSLNPVVSCGNIMKSEQASAFGFPNPMLGLVAYGIVICVGMSLLAGARFPPLVLARPSTRAPSSASASAPGCSTSRCTASTRSACGAAWPGSPRSSCSGT